MMTAQVAAESSSARLDVIGLNVGGMTFVTTTTTLMVPDSYFASRLSGRIPSGAEVDGAMFIDRDGEIFKYVLDYLRNLDRWTVPEDPHLLLRLLTEADFYSLTGLTESIKSSVSPGQMSFWVIINKAGQTGYSSVSTSAAPLDILKDLHVALDLVYDGQNPAAVTTMTLKSSLSAVPSLCKALIHRTCRYKLNNEEANSVNVIQHYSDIHLNDPVYTRLRKRLGLRC